MEKHTLLIDCPDEKGLVYKISEIIYKHHLNIAENGEFVERESSRFFMRTEVEGALAHADLLHTLRAVLPPESNIRLEKVRKKTVVVMVTKEAHCLGDLLVRHEFGELNCTIKAVIGNHNILQPLTERFGIPFHFINHEGLSREAHEGKLLELLEGYAPEWIVLAKFMRVLTPEFVARFPHRLVNIHHSFLPAFIGANPYRQAYERGVKIIGATAHFVTNDLDEGPIISQDVISVDHSQSALSMAKAGHDVEKIVLARALDKVLNDRVFVHGNKTIIFD